MNILIYSKGKESLDIKDRIIKQYGLLEITIDNILKFKGGDDKMSNYLNKLNNNVIELDEDITLFLVEEYHRICGFKFIQYGFLTHNYPHTLKQAKSLYKYYEDSVASIDIVILVDGYEISKEMENLYRKKSELYELSSYNLYNKINKILNKKMVEKLNYM